MLTKEFLSESFSLKEQAKGPSTELECGAAGGQVSAALSGPVMAQSGSPLFPSLEEGLDNNCSVSYQPLTAGASVLRIYPQNKPTLRGLTIQVQGSKQADEGGNPHTGEETGGLVCGGLTPCSSINMASS